MKPRTWLLLLSLCGALAVGGLLLRKLLRRAHAPLQLSTLVESDSPRQPTELAVAELLYNGELKPGWEDWGWGSHSLGGGPAKIVFEGYGGIVLHHAELGQPYGGFSFRFKAPEAFGDFLQVSLRTAGQPDDAFPTVLLRPRHVAVLPDGWQEALIEWQELNPAARPFDRVVIASRTAVGPEPVLLDRIFFTRGPTEAPQPSRLSVLCGRPTLPISELIYGGSRDDWDSGQSAQRFGGNPLSRDNWELGAWNVGKDWYFENQPQKTSLLTDIEQASRDHHNLAVVVPLIGWVAKDGNSVGFPRSQFPNQRAFDPAQPDAGDGFAPDGKPLTPSSPTLTSVPAPPELIKKWITSVAESDRRLGERSSRIYILDNEPTLWNVTHRDVHPEPLSYDELLQRTIDYAKVIREAAPGALIAGPAEWGWLGYQGSARDREAGSSKSPDRDAHGGTPLVAWYLRKLAEYEQRNGKRLLDLLDLHFYPAAGGVFDGAKTDTASSELRLRSTRALWDPSYLDESWIKERIQLIPRMREWVRQNYPGTKLMIGEWSFGADDHISGGLSAAEVLGRFGRQQLDAGFFWGQLKPDSPVFWAFRAFRNFDGKGGKFLERSVAVDERGPVSLFASTDGSGKHLVLVLVNRQMTSDSDARVGLEDCGRLKSVRAFRYAAGSHGLETSPADSSDKSVGIKLPAASIAVFDIDLAP